MEERSSDDVEAKSSSMRDSITLQATGGNGGGAAHHHHHRCLQTTGLNWIQIHGTDWLTVIATSLQTNLHKSCWWQGVDRN
jgi:hypothetical protein